MKRFSIVLAFIVSVLVVGCQNSDFSNPISPDRSSGVTSSMKGNLNPDGFIELKKEFSIRRGNIFERIYNLEGTIQYTLVYDGDNNYSLSLVTDATLRSQNEKEEGAVIYDESIELLKLSEKEVMSKSKTFTIDNFADNLQLHIEFQISMDAVEVSDIRLTESGKLATAKGTF